MRSRARGRTWLSLRFRREPDALREVLASNPRPGPIIPRDNAAASAANNTP